MLRIFFFKFYGACSSTGLVLTRIFPLNIPSSGLQEISITSSSDLQAVFRSPSLPYFAVGFSFWSSLIIFDPGNLFIAPRLLHLWSNSPSASLFSPTRVFIVDPIQFWFNREVRLSSLLIASHIKYNPYLVCPWLCHVNSNFKFPGGCVSSCFQQLPALFFGTFVA